MNGLNQEAIEEMLEEYFDTMQKIKDSELALQSLIMERTKNAVYERIDFLKKDRDFIYQMLSDEFVLGLYNSAVAIYFGLEIDSKGNLVRSINLLDKGLGSDA